MSCGATHRSAGTALTNDAQRGSPETDSAARRRMPAGWRTAKEPEFPNAGRTWSLSSSTRPTVRRIEAGGRGEPDLRQAWRCTPTPERAGEILLELAARQGARGSPKKSHA